jgi:hypothetical protein
VLAAGSQGAAIALIWLTKNVIDGALAQRDREKLWLYVGAVGRLRDPPRLPDGQPAA